MTTNPYAAPIAVDAADQASYQPRVFSFSGRIGRARYLAYGVLWNLVIFGVALVLMSVFGAIGGATSGSDTLASITLVTAFGAYAAALVPTFAMAVRRLNDLNTSGWLSLLMVVPLANIVLALILLFAPGTNGENSYGPPPVANNGWVIAGALVLPLIFVIGIVAAVALPAYQDYVARAQATMEQ